MRKIFRGIILSSAVGVVMRAQIDAREQNPRFMAGYRPQANLRGRLRRPGKSFSPRSADGDISTAGKGTSATAGRGYGGYHDPDAAVLLKRQVVWLAAVSVAHRARSQQAFVALAEAGMETPQDWPDTRSAKGRRPICVAGRGGIGRTDVERSTSGSIPRPDGRIGRCVSGVQLQRTVSAHRLDTIRQWERSTGTLGWPTSPRGHHRARPERSNAARGAARHRYAEAHR